MKFFKYLAPLVFVLLLGSVAFASTIPQAPTLFETYLANSQGSADTTATLASVALRDGSNLSGYTCLTIDSNTPSLEYECGTLSGTTFTVSVRGIDAVTGFTNSTALQFAHHRGADVKVTDYPSLTQLANIFRNTDTIANVISYAPTLSTTTIAQNRQNLADWGLVQDTALTGSGAIAATTAAKGYVQLSTTAQAANNSGLGSSGASLGLTSSIASSTGPYANGVVVASTTGYIDPTFLPPLLGKNYMVITSTGTSTFSVPGGITDFAITTIGSGAVGGSCNPSFQSQNAGGGSAAGLAFGIFNLSATTSVQVHVGAAVTSTTTTSQLGWSTFGTNGFYESALGGTPGTSFSGTQNGQDYNPVTGGTATGGIINLTGQSGGVGFHTTADQTSGVGGSTPLGYGSGGVAPVSSTTSSNGFNATGFGAGGSGALCPSSPQFLGGTGTNGVIIVNW